MKRIDPKTAVRPYLRPCNVYPFVVGTGPFQYAVSRSELKLACLLHDNLTLPASLVLEAAFLRPLMVELLPFLSAGTITMSLRSACNSFSELAKLKYGDHPQSHLSRMAELLDSTCKATLSFDAHDTAGAYKRDLTLFLEFLLSSSRNSGVRSALRRAEVELAEIELITLEKAHGLLDGCYLSQRFRAAAKLLYVTIGARAANSEAIVPASLWNAAKLFEGQALVSLTASSRQLAHAALMDYFVINASAIDKLSASSILDLKADPMTARCISELDQAVEQIAAQDAESVELKDLSKLADDRAKAIRNAVFSKCRKEEKQGKIEEWVFGTTEEVGGFFGNLVGVGPIKKGLTSVARKLARKNEKLRWLDYTSAPLVTYVSRYREFVGRHRNE